MSQLNKILQVMDLFSAERPALSAEQIALSLQLSRPTAFRYVRQLCDAGLLLNMAGSYTLGPRIIELDSCIRASDPILANSRDALRILSGTQACVAVLVTMYGEQVIHVHSESGIGAVGLQFTRGRNLPLLRGAASKIILANQPLNRLKRVYQRHVQQDDVNALGATSGEFVKYFRAVRQQGYYISRGEVEPSVTGLAAPITNVNGDVTSCLSLTFNHELNPDYDVTNFVPLVQSCAHDVSQRLAKLNRP
ncbi:IclR family transcriptional regulator [Diaphorobacter aerolatus]|uniref:Helix-turn-helix domain-containing protein n=1 Tax=Diaphorobacter aerolatus TaxID=1288495 RepID=A0A7H0GIP6_9BURK|nr:IclR family transcriptional regulator C-terminal domain-containing protein [Diaphorobacter aerolatus]QNP48162.1 helix-turn-helix domain-containing protein [Diaphorobacter aerolatus]